MLCSWLLRPGHSLSGATVTSAGDPHLLLGKAPRAPVPTCKSYSARLRVVPPEPQTKRLPTPGMSTGSLLTWVPCPGALTSEMPEGPSGPGHRASQLGEAAAASLRGTQRPPPAAGGTRAPLCPLPGLRVASGCLEGQEGPAALRSSASWPGCQCPRAPPTRVGPVRVPRRPHRAKGVLSVRQAPRLKGGWEVRGAPAPIFRGALAA